MATESTAPSTAAAAAAAPSASPGDCARRLVASLRLAAVAGPSGESLSDVQKAIESVVASCSHFAQSVIVVLPQQKLVALQQALVDSVRTLMSAVQRFVEAGSALGLARFGDNADGANIRAAAARLREGITGVRMAGRAAVFLLCDLGCCGGDEHAAELQAQFDVEFTGSETTGGLLHALPARRSRASASSSSASSSDLDDARPLMAGKR